MAMRVSRLEFSMKLATLSKPHEARSDKEYSKHYRPLRSSLTETAGPKSWKGQSDKRSTEELRREIHTYVAVTMLVQQDMVELEMVRIALAMIKTTVEGKAVEQQFSDFRSIKQSKGGDTANEWPTLDQVLTWMSESLTEPKTAADLRVAFSKIRQTNPGIPGLHTYQAKIIEDYQKLEDCGVEATPDLFGAKHQFRDGLDETIRLNVESNLLKTERLSDATESFRGYVRSIVEGAVLKREAIGQTPKIQAATAKAMQKQINAAVASQLGQKKRKGPNDEATANAATKAGDAPHKKRKPRKRKGKANSGNANKRGAGEMTAEQSAAGDSKKKKRKTKPAPSFKSGKANMIDCKPPKEWESRMCKNCGKLHPTDKCYYGKLSAERPDSWKARTKEEIAAYKKE